MDFRVRVDDDEHGEFWLDHCGALMDVEPMGDEWVQGMCHTIEDPTFDATALATSPHALVRPDPPPAARARPTATRTATGRCRSTPPTRRRSPTRTRRSSRARARPRAPVVPPVTPDGSDGLRDYSGPLDADLRFEDFSREVLLAILPEVARQSHLLFRGHLMSVAQRVSPEAASENGPRVLAGIAPVTAGRLAAAFGITGTDAASLARVLALHPSFQPPEYVDARDRGGRRPHRAARVRAVATSSRRATTTPGSPASAAPATARSTRSPGSSTRAGSARPVRDRAATSGSPTSSPSTPTPSPALEEPETALARFSSAPRTSSSAERRRQSASTRVELQRRVDHEPEPAAPGLLDPDRRVALVEAALQQDQPALEVVAELGQVERRVEPHLAVGELVAALGRVLVEQRPEDPAGDALDEVVGAEEHAAVDREEPHLRGRHRGALGRGARAPASAPSRARCAPARGRSRSRWRASRRRRRGSPRRRRRTRAARSDSTISTPTSRPIAIAGTASWASACSRPGIGISVPGPTVALGLEARPDRARRTCAPARTFDDPHRAALVGDDADRALADLRLGPDALGRVAVAGDRVEPVAGLVDEHQDRVPEPEQLVEAPQRRGDERVEVGRAAEPHAELGDLRRAAGRGAARRR